MKYILLGMLSLCLSATSALASPQDEINHLLKFVASTDCLFERNGSMHSGKEAVSHIKKKYHYYQDDIKSAEDFIKHSATKSSMSGQYYKIHCNNKDPIKSKDWLLEALAKYRMVQKQVLEVRVGKL